VHSDEEGWLLFDDTHIEKPGDWRTILTMMKKTGLQPSILFYEATTPVTAAESGKPVASS
jgi:hypothetical protein